MFTKQIEVNKERMSSERIYKCDNRFGGDPHDAGYFFPINVGAISPNTNGIFFTRGLCFEEITFSYSHTGDDNDIGDVVITINA